MLATGGLHTNVDCVQKMLGPLDDPFELSGDFFFLRFDRECW
jgi:hypothetical protein